ncbi:aspartyl-phosphate phosphatase Spo0E family protein [Peribacillus asahii]|uniref:aspartyl-phosphate phosphatase Spo0E family protein n=1 Tax=Peribacillus asahii TaxID=228899 RepID=UPI00380CF303
MENKIKIMKKLLINVTAIHNFNFQHHEVIRISQELDALIVAAMKGKHLTSIKKG